MKHTAQVYPVLLANLAHVRCVVVGGGQVAERKVAELLASGARPEVISPTLTVGLEQWHAEALITHVRQTYTHGSLHGAFLVIAATNDRTVNAQIAEEARRERALVNIVDDPQAGTFSTPATVRRGDLLLTVSTNGASPTLAARVRRELAARYGEEYTELLTLLRDAREQALQQLAPEQRARFWKTFDMDAVVEWLRRGDRVWAEQYIREALARAQSNR